jgi:hypothetical protein
LNPSAPVQTYTTGSYADLKVRIENNGQAGDYTTKDFYIYEGNITNPVFKPYEGVMKPAILYPKKNLLKPFTDSDWIYNVATVDKDGTVLTITSSMAYSSGRIYIENIKPNTTYTFTMEIEGGMVTPKIELFADSSLINTLMNAATTTSPYTFTFTTTSNTNRMRLWLQNTGSGGVITYRKVQISADSAETPFQPYELTTMKPL